MRPGSHAADDGSFGRSAGIQAGRATVLIVVAVVIGFLLLHRTPGAVSIGGTTPGSSVTTRTSGNSTPGISSGIVPGLTTTTAPLRTPQNIKVLVANGTSTAGLAGRVSDTLHAKGYDTLSPVDSTQHPSSTIVYFEPGYGNDAAALAGKLGLPSSAVSAMPPAPPVANLNGAQILVVAGANLIGSSAASSTTSTT